MRKELALFAVWFVLGGTSVSVAQESLEEIKPLPPETKLRPLEPFVALPVSPSPLKSVPPLKRSDQPKKRGLWYLSPVPRSWQEATLYSGLVVDTVSTIQMMSHPQYLSSRDGSWRNAHDNMAFKENGWAKFVGPRNIPGVVAMNVGLDVLIVAGNRLLQNKTKNKGGGWRVLRWVGNSFLLAKGAGRLYTGINNYRHTRQWEKYLAQGRTDVFWHDKPFPN